MEMYDQVWGWIWLISSLTISVLLVSWTVFNNGVLLKPKKRTSTGGTATVTANSTSAPSSNPSSSISPPGWDYEVFLSFRGTDTRTGFTDCLYHALVDAGIRAFRDNEELRVGEQIGPEILKAIQQSKISIPIFSTDYASSKWCLLELAQMVECMRSMGQMILPVFYDVEPSDVRHQKGSYQKCFREHKKRFNEEIVLAWKEALREVAELKGWDLNNDANGHQGELIRKVVQKVWQELKKNSMVITDYLVGIDYHVEEMMKLLNVGSNDVRIVGICGMGGIGKTTIAKVIYNQLSEHFDCHSFLADVRETSQQHNGLVNLQSRLVSDILKRKSLEVASVDEGINVIKTRFRDKKVIVVLDDVDQRLQLESIAGERDWFGSGSRIIVTTRNKDVLSEPEVNETYEPREMDSDQSLKLFSKHAFRRGYPLEDYDILSRDLVSTTGGLPLAIEVIGSFLSGKGKAIWDDTLEKLRKIPHKDVQKKLRISYEALDYVQKQIFLDIACLFIGVDKRIAFHMWKDCEFYPAHGIEVLLICSLVKIGDDNELRMHDQLRDLGREIVHQENPKEPGERSRLWYHKEALGILESRMGTRKVEALRLDFGFEPRHCYFTNEDFARLSNIRFLQMDYANLAGDFKHLFLKLRWLRWKACPQNFRPTNFHLKNLVILDLSWSKITEDWEGWNQIKMEKLKVLNLTGCANLTKTPDFSRCATLESLIIERCENLVQIDPSIEHLKGLVFLNMKNCTKLSKIPSKFSSLGALIDLRIDLTSIKQVPFSEGIMTKLEIFSAKGCLTEIPSSIGDLKSLSDLVLDFSRFTELPDSIGLLLKLRRLSLRNCSRLKELPESIGNLESLVELDMSSSAITELPDTIGALKKVRVLNIAFTCVRKLPNAIGMLEKLEEIHASRCSDLEGEIPGNIVKLSSLRILKLNYTQICSLPTSMRGLSCLQTLDLEGCERLHLLPEIELPSSLMNLHVVETLPNLSDCSFKLQTLTLSKINCSTLPMEIGTLSRLKELSVENCEKLQCLPGLPSSLFKLSLKVCESLERTPNLSNLENLSELYLFECFKITEIQGVGKLESLRSLTISECGSLKTLPDLSNLKKLRELDTTSCWNLIGIQGLDSLESLEYLNMKRNISMERLPDLSNLEMLTDLRLFRCEKLYEIEGLEDLTSLNNLQLSFCISLERLPDLSNLKSLKKLRVRNCKKLIEIRGLEELSLIILDICGCKSLKNLPDLSNIKTVER